MTRPKASRDLIQAKLAEAWQKEYGTKPLPNLALVGVRSYYRDTMGRPGTNDRGIYDDALFVISDKVFKPFNGNTDPSIFRKNIATLIPGIHWYRKGNHGISRPGGGYPAFRPATKNEELPVERDGVKVPWPGVAINIHRGGVNTTSSEGCQTIPPSQWDDFYKSLSGEMDRLKLKEFPYVLITGPIV